MIRERGGRNRWGRGERWSKGPGDRTGRPGAGVKKEGGVRNPFSDRKGPRGVSLFALGPLFRDTLCLPHSASVSNPGISPGYIFYIFLRNKQLGKGPAPWCSKRTAETSANRITFIPLTGRAKATQSRACTIQPSGPCHGIGPRENVDSGASDGLLWQVLR